MSKLPVTVGRARRAARSLLSTASETAALDADILLSETLSLSRNLLDLFDSTELDTNQQQRFSALLDRRLAGEPIAYITQSKEFWSIEVTVNPATLVPRPETELVVERALFHGRSLARPMIADLGTGSGCIALALVSELKNAQIVATDLSSDALEVARHNCESLGLRHVEFFQGNWTDALPHREFDLIVANPPYIADSDPCLQDPVMGFEPVIALRGGGDGLESIRSILVDVHKYLKPGGWLIIEHGYTQGASVRRLFSENQLDECHTFKDLAGLERVTEGCRTRVA